MNKLEIIRKQILMIEESMKEDIKYSMNSISQISKTDYNKSIKALITPTQAVPFQFPYR